MPTKLRISALVLGVFMLCTSLPADPLPIVSKVAAQPLAAHVKVLIEALDYLGNPLPQSTRAAIDAALNETDQAKQIQALQEALDPLCLIGIQINPESRVKVTMGNAAPELMENGWRQFLVKVQKRGRCDGRIKGR